jgi:hypothetical protein
MALITTRLVVDQGTDFIHEWLWQVKDPTTGTVAPKDLTGYSARMEIRKHGLLLCRLHSSDATAHGTITLGGASGTVAIRIPDEVSTLWKWRSARYDLELFNAAGIVVRFVEGLVIARTEVTTGV